MANRPSGTVTLYVRLPLVPPRSPPGAAARKLRSGKPLLRPFWRLVLTQLPVVHHTRLSTASWPPARMATATSSPAHRRAPGTVQPPRPPPQAFAPAALVASPP